MKTGIDVVILLCQQIVSCGKIRYEKLNDKYVIYCNNYKIFEVNGYKILVKNTDIIKSYLLDVLDYNREESDNYFIINDVNNKKLLCNITKAILNENNI